VLFAAVAWVAFLGFGSNAYAADASTSSTDNSSAGTAGAATGDASATGNSTGTGATQTASGGSGIQQTDQKVQVTNEGTATANTGGNTATGNNSDNTVTNDQDTTSGGDATVQSNTGNASNSSNGSATIVTGNATATGNTSWTTVTQGDPGAGLAFVDQNAIVTNDGTAFSDTGDNEAIGNNSLNFACNEQQITSPGCGPGVPLGSGSGQVLSNVGEVTNTSDGTAGVTTGDANSTGSSSSTSVAQWAATAVTTGLGGIFDLGQSARVSNTGDAEANTGFNEAIGNNSDNVATNDQDATSARGPPGNAQVILSNIGTTSNWSDGTASITTGAADAIGVSSSTTITQTGESLNSDLLFIDQRARVRNDGVGLATTGDNVAIGNDSFNEADNDQGARINETGPGSAIFHGDVVLSNIAETSNTSDGSASITTGAAQGTGVDSSHTTTIAQTANGASDATGFAFIDQTARVNNFGTGTGNSGDNVAIGNESDNFADNVQVALISEQGPGDLVIDDAVLSNIGTTTNNSDGSADITTGSAHGLGIASTDTITQDANVAFANDGFAEFAQSARVNNDGFASGDSGDNLAIGNDSVNDAENSQNARIRESGTGDLVLDDPVLSNIGETSNSSNGSASITTGTACACNTSTTTIGQSANFANGDDGFATFDQTARVNNVGTGFANSGDNLAIGNDSDNFADNDQTTELREFDAGDLIAGDVVASNIGSTSNTSDGSADITTGAAQGTGITSTTTIDQGANFANGDDGFALFDQRARVLNLGDGTAITGDNIALGNDTDNTADNDQTDRIRETDAGNLFVGDTVLSNIGETLNSSNGSASIATGDATAYGNYSTTGITQWAGFANGDAGFALPTQRARVDNVGDAFANSGDNLAIGNDSFNRARNRQRAGIRETGLGSAVVDDSVLSNIGSLTNASDGSADITTGNATAYANASNTWLTETADIDIVDAGFVILDQTGRVNNVGIAVADTGDNDAIGNDSDNTARNRQTTRIREDGPGNLFVDDAVLNNTGDTSNLSAGSASITTGTAYALGNYSATNMILSAATGASQLTLASQALAINNFGDAAANSGNNDADGNDSVSDVDNTQDSPIEEFGPGSLVVDSVVSNNSGDAVNASDGTSSVATGAAVAIGNVSVQSACSGLNTTVDCPVASLPPLPPPSCPCQTAVVTPPPTVPPTTPVPAESGEELPVTGSPLGVQVLLGLLLIGLGSAMRRRTRMAT
jgi:hypothetical protein